MNMKRVTDRKNEIVMLENSGAVFDLLQTPARSERSVLDQRIADQFGVNAFHSRAGADGTSATFKSEPMLDPDGAREAFVPFERTRMRYQPRLDADERRMQDHFEYEQTILLGDESSINTLQLCGTGRVSNPQQVENLLRKFGEE